MILAIGLIDGLLYSLNYGADLDAQLRGAVTGLLIVLPIGLWETWLPRCLHTPPTWGARGAL